MDGYFAYVMVVITMRPPYLEHTLLIEKLLEQKKFLKALPIMQKQGPPHNKRSPIFVSHMILAEKLDVFVIVYLDNILIYTESEGKEHVEAVWWVLDQLQKHLLYANLKKCRFHQEEVRFLGYIVSHQGIRMEEERIKAVRDWPEPQSVRDIQVFLGFANFYRRFIQGFSRLAALLTSMLKTKPLYERR